MEKNRYRKKILIVDEDAETRTLLKEVLASDYLVFEADNGQEGLLIFNFIHPGLVITNMIIPSMSGTELVRRIRSSKRDIQVKIIALSGSFHSKEDRAEIIEAGADFCLPKPINIDSLKEMVNGNEQL